MNETRPFKALCVGGPIDGQYKTVEPAHRFLHAMELCPTLGSPYDAPLHRYSTYQLQSYKCDCDEIHLWIHQSQKANFGAVMRLLIESYNKHSTAPTK